MFHTSFTYLWRLWGVEQVNLWHWMIKGFKILPILRANLTNRLLFKRIFCSVIILQWLILHKGCDRFLSLFFLGWNLHKLFVGSLLCRLYLLRNRVRRVPCTQDGLAFEGEAVCTRRHPGVASCSVFHLQKNATFLLRRHPNRTQSWRRDMPSLGWVVLGSLEGRVKEVKTICH